MSVPPGSPSGDSSLLLMVLASIKAGISESEHSTGSWVGPGLHARPSSNTGLTELKGGNVSPVLLAEQFPMAASSHTLSTRDC